MRRATPGDWRPSWLRNVGEYLVVAGNDQPTWIDRLSDADSFVLNEALKYPRLDNAVATAYKACDVGASGLANDDYPAGYSKGILLTNHAAGQGPQVGQLLAFGTTPSARHTYTVIEAVVVTAHVHQGHSGSAAGGPRG